MTEQTPIAPDEPALDPNATGPQDDDDTTDVEPVDPDDVVDDEDDQPTDGEDD